MRSADSCFSVYACRNQLAGARLGVTVARKTAASAVARNRLKRLVRESFRRQRALLAPLDIVVQARPAAKDTDNEGIRASLDWHWQEIARRCRVS